jgi:16S rRNA (cytosine1402-N4)-methyltransferase
MTSDAGCYHVPVLLQESIDGLAIKPNGAYIDVTFGGGGHSRAILEKLGQKGQLLGFDQDEDAIANAPADKRFTFVKSNFRYLWNWTQFLIGKTVEKSEGYIDGILADLGVSSHDFDEAERGFSFRFDGPLDMRMNRSAQLSAADVVNTYPEERLARIFSTLGEVSNGRQLAAAIVKARAKQEVKTTGELVEILHSRLDWNSEKKNMAKVFQALRMEVNEELGALQAMLEASVELLKPGGRLVVLTYHSLEDRMVKNIMRTGNCDGLEEKDFYGNSLSPMRPINRKVVQPDAQEQERNPRSRSAKLRIAERISAISNK